MVQCNPNRIRLDCRPSVLLVPDFKIIFRHCLSAGLQQPTTIYLVMHVLLSFCLCTDLTFPFPKYPPHSSSAAYYNLCNFFSIPFQWFTPDVAGEEPGDLPSADLRGVCLGRAAGHCRRGSDFGQPAGHRLSAATIWREDVLVLWWVVFVCVCAMDYCVWWYKSDMYILLVTQDGIWFRKK